MAKKSKIARNKQRQEVVDRYAAKRLELKKQLVDPNATDEQREAARGEAPKPRSSARAGLRQYADEFTRFVAAGCTSSTAARTHHLRAARDDRARAPVVADAK